MAQTTKKRVTKTPQDNLYKAYMHMSAASVLMAKSMVSMEVIDPSDASILSRAMSNTHRAREEVILVRKASRRHRRTQPK